MTGPSRVTVVDSHTGGEPTRVVIDGGPALGVGPMADRRTRFAQQHDAFRAAVVNEPRGSDVLVGALLCDPHDPTCDIGVVFFNNVGVLGMCGHGAIGVAVTLHHTQRIELGPLRLDTPVGVVVVELLDEHRAAVTNVPSFRHCQTTVDVPPFGQVTGDVAWGGNWFFLTGQSPVPIGLEHVDALTEYTLAIRRALTLGQVTGADGGEIDHIEVFGPPQAGGDSRNFVLCPGAAYDRSPCGTGTSAKVACLAADGTLQAGDVWRQESVVGSIFEATYAPVLRKPQPAATDAGPTILPTITGEAYVTAESVLHFSVDDPFRWGIPSTRNTTQTREQRP